MVNVMINFSFQEIKDVKNAAFQNVVTFEILLRNNGNLNSLNVMKVSQIACLEYFRV